MAREAVSTEAPLPSMSYVCHGRSRATDCRHCQPVTGGGYRFDETFAWNDTGDGLEPRQYLDPPEDGGAPEFYVPQPSLSQAPAQEVVEARLVGRPENAPCHDEVGLRKMTNKFHSAPGGQGRAQKFASAVTAAGVNGLQNVLTYYKEQGSGLPDAEIIPQMAPGKAAFWYPMYFSELRITVGGAGNGVLKALREQEITLENGAMVAYEDAYVFYYQHRHIDTKLEGIVASLFGVGGCCSSCFGCCGRGFRRASIACCCSCSCSRSCNRVLGHCQSGVKTCFTGYVTTCFLCGCCFFKSDTKANFGVSAELRENMQSFIIPRGSVCSVSYQSLADEQADVTVMASRPGQRSCCLDTCCCCCFPTAAQLRLSHSNDPVTPNTYCQNLLLKCCSCTLTAQPISTWVTEEPSMQRNHPHQRDVTFGMQSVILPGSGEEVDALFRMTVAPGVGTDAAADFVGLLQEEALQFESFDDIIPGGAGAKDDPKHAPKENNVTRPFRMPLTVTEGGSIFDSLLGLFQ